jgi:hypothetical protein
MKNSSTDDFKVTKKSHLNFRKNQKFGTLNES